MNKIILFSAGLLSLTACRNEQLRTQDSVTVQVIHPEPFVRSGLQSFDFISEPYRTSELSFRVGGPIRSMDIESGQFFRSGSLIAALDPRDYQTALSKRQAEIVQKDAEFRRMENLYKKGNVSAADYERARAEMETAHANGQQARHDLQDTRLTAPFDGYVQQVLAERYDEVTPSQPVLTFIDLSRIKMSVSIPEQTALALSQSSQPACRVVFSSIPGDTLKADEVFVTRSTSSANISYTCTALLSNSQRKYLGGMSGVLLLDTPETGRETLSLPLHVICNDPMKGSYVWTVDTQQRAQRTWIRTGELGTGNRVEILQGLHSDQKVITGHFNRLSANTQVTVK